jgi:hypothetical protein
VGGALLAELLLRGRIRVDFSSRRSSVEVLIAAPLDDPLLDECLQAITQAKQRKTPQTWVAKFARIKQLKRRVADRLCNRGILRVADGRVLGLFSRKTYPEVDPRPEQELIERMRRAILSDSAELDPRTVARLSLACHSGLLKLVLPKGELQLRKARIAQIIRGEVAGKAVKEVIESIQAATTIAALVPAITSV